MPAPISAPSGAIRAQLSIVASASTGVFMNSFKGRPDIAQSDAKRLTIPIAAPDMNATANIGTAAATRPIFELIRRPSFTSSQPTSHAPISAGRKVFSIQIDPSDYPRFSGWGGRIRTYGTRYQKPLPYRLATPQPCRASYSIQWLFGKSWLSGFGRYTVKPVPATRAFFPAALRLLLRRLAAQKVVVGKCFAFFLDQRFERHLFRGADFLSFDAGRWCCCGTR
jgi:hypothetical protein